LFLSFGPLADSSLFSYCFGFWNVFVCGYYYPVYPCPSKTLRGSNFCMVFLLTLFYPLSFCDKKGGVIFYLDRDCIFNQSSDFCPIMAKGGVC
jgi:hypothetical protein